jgi:hypothetical protein
VYGGASVPLDFGRESRWHSKAQRIALSGSYDTCAAEGCARPFAWTEIHHPEAWANGGRTDLDNALPLCGWHHRRAHDGRYDLRRMTSGEGRFRRRPWAGRLPGGAGRRAIPCDQRASTSRSRVMEARSGAPTRPMVRSSSATMFSITWLTPLAPASARP